MGMKRSPNLTLIACAVVLAGGTMVSIVRAGAQGKAAAAPATFGFGRPATSAEIAAWDIDIGPDGAGLPPGRGSAADGATLYAARCAACHGKSGTEGPNDVLVGKTAGQAFPFAADARIPKTIGNYWPYATTLFDYVRRAMPPDAPGSLKDDEVYALVAHLLAWNGIVGGDAVLDAATLAKVRMPARDRFVPDPRTMPKPKPPRR
jgi:cytochrome c